MELCSLKASIVDCALILENLHEHPGEELLFWKFGPWLKSLVTCYELTGKVYLKYFFKRILSYFFNYLISRGQKIMKLLAKIDEWLNILWSILILKMCRMCNLSIHFENGYPYWKIYFIVRKDIKTSLLKPLQVYKKYNRGEPVRCNYIYWCSRMNLFV